MKSESIKELATALAKVKFGPITRSKTVKVTSRSTGAQYAFQYAPLEDIMSAIRAPLAEQGLSLTQSVERLGETLAVETILLHSSGEWKSCYVPIVEKKAIDKDGKPISPSPQEVGSAITYARRYGVTLVCCLVADEDDDANIAEGNDVSVEKPLLKAPIAPASGVLEALPPETRAALAKNAIAVIALGEAGKIPEAFDKCADLKRHMDADEQIAFWSLFPSNLRSALKKHGEKIKESKDGVRAETK